MKKFLINLYDICDIRERFSAGQYVEKAAGAIKAILERDKLPIVVGGTGLYVRSLMIGFFEEPGPDDTVEESLRTSLEHAGLEYLYRMLQRVDPGALRPNCLPGDTQRVLHGLTVYFSAGRRLTELWKDTKPAAARCPVPGGGPGQPLGKQLYRVIDERVDGMMEAGLLEEVTRVAEAGGGQIRSTRLRQSGTGR